MYDSLAAKILLLISCCCFSLLVGASSKSPLPELVTKEWQGMQMLGETRLKKLGFHIYDASFWTQDKNKLENNDMENVSALSITYARKIKAEKLISITKKEWQRLAYDDKYPIYEWMIMLKNIWPDVKKSDQLIVVSTPQGKSIFYDKNKRLGTIDDADFGPAFLAIWIDKNSRYKKNRLELMGKVK